MDSLDAAVTAGWRTGARLLRLFICWTRHRPHESTCSRLMIRSWLAGLIYLDNYDLEAWRSALPFLTALIDRKISKYISGMNGIVKRLKDKYFFAIKQQYMADTGRAFSILEDVRTVNANL